MYQMVEENNEMLKKILKKGRWGIFFKTIKYIIIIVLTIGAWYYTKPFVDKAQELYIKVNETSDSIGELKDKAGSAFDFSNLFKKE